MTLLPTIKHGNGGMDTGFDSVVEEVRGSTVYIPVQTPVPTGWRGVRWWKEAGLKADEVVCLLGEGIEHFVFRR